jgi:ferric-dicitrate binding protein FerR (iron transport regulator)
MNDLDPRDEEFGRRASDALAALPRAEPDPAFRARQKQAFVAGAYAPVERPVAVRRPNGMRRAFLALASAAAVLLVVGVTTVMNAGPRWKVASVQAAHGNVLVNDEPIPADDTASLNEALTPGAVIEWNGSGDLELVSTRELALGIAPGTKMTLPAPPPRWFARTSRGAIETGTIRLASGKRFHGARVTITTPEATVEMTGTMLSVIHEPMGTCVCVFEGAVRVMAGTHDMGMVPAGQRQVVFADGSAPIRAEMRPTERAKLGEMKEGVHAELERGGD